MLIDLNREMGPFFAAFVDLVNNDVCYMIHRRIAFQPSQQNSRRAK